MQRAVWGRSINAVSEERCCAVSRQCDAGEFVLMLCNDAGELLEIDGGIQEVNNDIARVLSRE